MNRMSRITSGLALALAAVLCMAQPADAQPLIPNVEYTSGQIITAAGPDPTICGQGGDVGERPPACDDKAIYIGNEIVTLDPDGAGKHVSAFDGSRIQFLSGAYCVGVRVPDWASGSLRLVAYDQGGDPMFQTTSIPIVPEMTHFGVCSDQLMEEVSIHDDIDGLVQFYYLMVGTVRPWIVERCAGAGANVVIAFEQGLAPRVIVPRSNGCAYYTPWTGNTTFDYSISIPPGEQP